MSWAGGPAARMRRRPETDGLADRDDLSKSVLARGFEILRAFRPGEGKLANGKIAAATGLPRATVSRLTRQLTALGYLTHDPRSGTYEPSASILALGYCVIANLRVRQLARGQMQRLALEEDVNVALASRDRLQMIFVETCDGPSITTLRLEIGQRVGLPHTAIGRAFLAGISGKEREYLFGHLARLHGEDWPGLHRLVMQGVEQVAARGFCLVRDEWHRGTIAVAAPLVSIDGRTVMAMNCGAPSFMTDPERLEHTLGPRLVHICRGLAPLVGS